MTLASLAVPFSVFTIFISGIIVFYSGQTPEWRAELGLPSRYMLPAITLSFVIWSFLIVRFHNYIRKHLKLSILKTPLTLSVFAFFIFAFAFSPPIQFLVDNENFTNPIDVNEKYSLSKEILPQQSVILAKNTDKVIENGAIPFQLNDDNTFDSEKISLLLNIMDKGYSVYTFKKSTLVDEKESLLNIVNEYDVILKEYSEIYCQLEINNTQSNDETCLYDD